jgi:archaemetzincin
MDLQNITLISFGYYEKDFLDSIGESLEQEFHLPIKIREGHIDLSEYYDPARRQYDGLRLLKEVDSRVGPETLKAMGLFNVDLFIPILTYIFGQAFLNGRSGIASMYRFSNKRYGIKEDNHIILDRLKKEVIHELGHTFGLTHCYIPTCVMRSSTYVEDIDQKSQNICPGCRLKIELNTPEI